MQVTDTITETTPTMTDEVTSKAPKSENLKDTWLEFVKGNFSEITGFWGKVRAALKILKFMVLYG